MQEEMQSIFYRFEDRLQEKGVLVGVAPRSMVGVQLQAQAYTDNGAQKHKVHVLVEVCQRETDDEDMFEAIADTVSDYLREHGIAQELSAIGVDPDTLDWFTVGYSYVGGQATPTKATSPSPSDKKLALVFHKYESILRLSDALEGYDIAPEDVAVSGAFYQDQGTQKLKAIVALNQHKLALLDDDDREAVADTVADLFRDQGIAQDLARLGIDPDLLDWYQLVAADADSGGPPAVRPATQLRDLQTVMQAHADNSSVYLGSHVPAKKVAAAIKEYAAGVDPSQVLLFVDTTLFGSGKEGFLITSQAVYTKPSMGQARVLPLQDFKQAYLKQEAFAYVYIAEQRVIAAPSTLRACMEVLVDFLQRVEI